MHGGSSLAAEPQQLQQPPPPPGSGAVTMHWGTRKARVGRRGDIDGSSPSGRQPIPPAAAEPVQHARNFTAGRMDGSELRGRSHNLLDPSGRALPPGAAGSPAAPATGIRAPHHPVMPQAQHAVQPSAPFLMEPPPAGSMQPSAFQIPNAQQLAGMHAHTQHGPSESHMTAAPALPPSAHPAQSGVQHIIDPIQPPVMATEPQGVPLTQWQAACLPTAAQVQHASPVEVPGLAGTPGPGPGPFMGLPGESGHPAQPPAGAVGGLHGFHSIQNILQPHAQTSHPQGPAGQTLQRHQLQQRYRRCLHLDLTTNYGLTGERNHWLDQPLGYLEHR